MEVPITAEIEKKKPEKQKTSQLDEERAAKLEKLKQLKQKLAEIEKQEESTDQQKVIDVKLLTKDPQSSQTEKIDSELSELESSIAQEINQSDELEKDEKLINSTINKLSGFL